MKIISPLYRLRAFVIASQANYNPFDGRHKQVRSEAVRR